MRAFWRWLALFSYRRWARDEPQNPVGVPGNRDHDSPCDAYAPRPKRLRDWGGCVGDGHYLCVECAHYEPEPVEEEAELWLRPAHER